MAKQQEQFASTLQMQIDDANAETERLRAEFAAESAAATAQADADVSAYTTTATMGELPTGGQTTAATTKKKKPNSSLKISSAGTANKAGSGLNIGV